MGIIIERCKTNASYKGRSHKADAYATDATGRLVPHAGEIFETMPLGCLDLLSFITVGSANQRNPETVEGMQWEIGFSDKRVSFFSPDSAKLLKSSAKRARHATLGFYYYHELRSLSLGSNRNEDGPFVSLIFVIRFNWFSQIPMRVRVTGPLETLRIFATALTARLLEYYDELGSRLGVEARELKILFEEVTTFDFLSSVQTDLFINAQENSVRVSRKLVAG